MIFSLSHSLEILERTPGALIAMLHNISDEWTSVNEGGETWSVFDILGHLVHGEKTDWVPRMDIILSDNPGKLFEPFDRFAQTEDSKGKNLSQLLDEFKILRENNMQHLRSKNLASADLLKTGVHPSFGEVTLAQLLATWTVHDLNHLAQISRVMATQYKSEVGPWIAYLGILQK
jgi:hypothetical protein